MTLASWAGAGLWLGLLGALAPAVAAQDLPAYRPINPVVTSRTDLGFVPYRSPRPGRWEPRLSVDYANAIESRRTDAAAELVDAELLRLDLGVSRDLGHRWFVAADLPLQGAYGGFLDGFLDWYHRLIGISMPERLARPHDAFAYQLSLPDGMTVTRGRSGAFLGDTRLSLGRRHGRSLQSVLTVSLPTSTGPRGYGLGTVGASLFTTVRAPLTRRLLAEGGWGVGYTPRFGELRQYQRTFFTNAAAGLRYRFWGRQSLYATLYYGSAVYRGTTLSTLDGSEVTLDFGWILATSGGREWRIGMTEDPRPSGPAVDVVFRFGWR